MCGNDDMVFSISGGGCGSSSETIRISRNYSCGLTGDGYTVSRETSAGMCGSNYESIHLNDDECEMFIKAMRLRRNNRFFDK